MKIENKGIVITDVPAVENIHVDSDGVRIDWSDDVWTGDAADLRQLIEALQEALKAAEGKDQTGPWARWQDIPDSVNKVLDRDGDVIVKTFAQTWAERMEGSPDYRNNHYAPYQFAQ